MFSFLLKVRKVFIWQQSFPPFANVAEHGLIARSEDLLITHKVIINISMFASNAALFFRLEVDCTAALSSKMSRYPHLNTPWPQARPRLSH